MNQLKPFVGGMLHRNIDCIMVHRTNRQSLPA